MTASSHKKNETMNSPTSQDPYYYHEDQSSVISADENVALHIENDDDGYEEWDDRTLIADDDDDEHDGALPVPNWVANPQSPTQDRPLSSSASSSLPPPPPSPQRSSSRRNHNVAYSSPQVRKTQVPVLLLGLALVGLAAVFLSRTSVNYAAKQVSILAANRNHLDEKLQKAERDLTILKREISAMDAMIHKQQAIDSHSTASEASRQLAMNEMNALQGRLQNLAQQGEDLKHHVQTISRQGILAKYGGAGDKNGQVKQHLVEIELVFPDGKEGPNKFVIQLEGNLMPHSSFTFLEMVSLGLLDGCSFILNALHVLKAAPLPYDGTSAATKARAFSAHGLESVAFKEYNEAFPHKRYTVGFAADGSPSFYINTEDNTEIHVGDPCFGRIVEGFDTIKRLEASPTRNGIWYAKRIGIKHARILNWSPPNSSSSSSSSSSSTTRRIK